MSESWEIARLGDVCSKIQDGAHKSPQALYSEPGEGRFPYLTSKNIRTGYLKLDTVQYCDAQFHNEIYPRCNPEVGDVLLTKDGANTGNVAINDFEEPFSLLSSVCLLKPNRSRLVPRFLFYYLQSKEGFEQITGQMTGAAIKRIILRTIKSSTIPLPSPSEQKRIVAILDEAFDGIAAATANTEKNLANARELFDGYLNAIFTHHVASAPMTPLSTHCEKITVGHVGSMKSKYCASGIPFLRSQNILPFQISLKGVKFIDEEFNASLSKSQLRPGDVGIVRTGYPGTAAVIPESLPLSNCSDIVIARPGESLDPHYLALFLNSTFGKALVGANLVGAAQKHFNVTAAKNAKIPIPSVDVQKAEVEKAERFKSATEELKQMCRDKLACLAELKQSLLQKAFSGQLTADADRTRQSAAVLAD